jgi:hypothetical protein
MPKRLASFKPPGQIKISARTSSITNAFINGIIPFFKPSTEEMLASLEALEMSPDDVQCAYCGDEATEWDHLNPLIDDQAGTGYITEIANLVPSCGKCNQSMGNESWKLWIKSSATKSPTQRGIVDLERRIGLLEKYEVQFKPTIVNLSDHVTPELWKKHWENHVSILAAMKEANIVAETIRKEIASKFGKILGTGKEPVYLSIRKEAEIEKRLEAKIRDESKYFFDGKEYGKGRLVLAVVKRYVSENQNISFENLKSVFPDILLGGRLGVFTEISKALEIYERTKLKRHYISASDVIKLSDESIAVSTQWKIGNIEKLIFQAGILGYKIESI